MPAINPYKGVKQLQQLRWPRPVRHLRGGWCLMAPANLSPPQRVGRFIWLIGPRAIG